MTLSLSGMASEEWPAVRLNSISSLASSIGCLFPLKYLLHEQTQLDTCTSLMVTCTAAFSLPQQVLSEQFIRKPDKDKEERDLLSHQPLTCQQRRGNRPHSSTRVGQAQSATSILRAGNVGVRVPTTIMPSLTGMKLALLGSC